MSVFLAFVKPILFKLATSPQVKTLVLELLKKYVLTKDNSIDNTIYELIESLMFKDQVTGEVSPEGKKILASK